MGWLGGHCRMPRPRGPARAGGDLPKPRRQDRQTEESSSQRVVGVCQLGVRAAWWIDWLLRQTRTHYHNARAARAAISQGNASWLETPIRCVNLVDAADPRNVLSARPVR